MDVRRELTNPHRLLRGRIRFSLRLHYSIVEDGTFTSGICECQRPSRDCLLSRASARKRRAYYTETRCAQISTLRGLATSKAARNQVSTNKVIMGIHPPVPRKQWDMFPWTVGPRVRGAVYTDAPSNRVSSRGVWFAEAFGKRWIDGFSCHTPQSLVMRPDDNTCILNALPTQRDISPLHAPRKWAPASLHRDASQHTTRRTCHPSRSRHGCSRESAVSPVQTDQPTLGSLNP